MDQKNLARIALWGRIVGMTTMILGVLAALSGLLLFIVGAIPGVISAWMGFEIYKTGTSAKRLIESGDQSDLENILNSYAKYLLINGIMMIINIVFILISFFLFGAAIFSLVGAFG